MTRKARRGLASLMLSLAATLLMAGVAAAQLTVGVHPDNRPWEFRDASGAYAGFDIDMMTALGRELGVAVAVTSMSFDKLFTELEAGRLDVVVSSITVTPARLARFDFTQPYYRTSQAVAVLRTAGIKDLAGLSGKAVAVAPGSTNEAWLEANRDRHAIRAIRRVDSIDEALALLRSGEVGAYFDDEPALLHELLESRDLAVIARRRSQDRYAIMLRQGSPWTARLDAALSRLKQDGTLADIHRKWFGSRPPADSPVAMVLPRP